MIDAYEFGRIVIDGKEYTHDVRIFPSGVKDWWREASHNVTRGDIQEVADAKPEKIVIGNGHDCTMKMPADTLSWLEEQGIKVVVMQTKEATEEYNNSDKEKTIACLHLTC